MAFGPRLACDTWMAEYPGEWHVALDRRGNGHHAPTLIADLVAYASWWFFVRIAVRE